MTNNVSAGHSRRRKVGLALSSGVARGWAHIGAIRALNRLGVPFDIVSGCSAGALVGGCYLARQLDQLEKWALSLSSRRVVGYLDLSFGRGGMIKGEKIKNELRKFVGQQRIEDLHAPFIAVATDLGTGHEVWLREGDLAEAIRASIAMPGLLPPIESRGRWLADGALLDPMPVAAARSLGADLVIAVNLNTDILGKMRQGATSSRLALGFDPGALLAAQAELAERAPPQSLTQGIFGGGRENPNIFGVMMTSLSIMQDRLTRSRLAGDPPDVHITPRVGHIGLLEFERAEEAIREGENAVERARPELLDALEAMGLAI
ncbi:patatin-like phospholipase RssA [Methylocystis bryophila]|uniref:Lysophospholipase n=1 Tax=Methylocystis bryophila TaxID=655015 RepID=A0A1W6MXT7_9HYPH|nr:patatin-like phospholipase RssA [Methylocystis bryophila]ARN82410.1 lysophospholipase [Methylocystis bryophila]BDV38587.1 phospholipase [Methylocystis bryophila]